MSAEESKEDKKQAIDIEFSLTAHHQPKRHPQTTFKSTLQGKPYEMPFTPQTTSPLHPIGVTAALSDAPPTPKIFDEFRLTDRVGIVSGGNRGLGLEMALALAEAGARAVYCFDLPPTPGEEWTKTSEFVSKMTKGAGRLEYVSLDVRNQKAVWDAAEKIGDREGRMDFCVAAAGIAKPDMDCLTYPANELEEVMDTNVNGVLYTAQAAGTQMERFKCRGSIILVASMSGSLTNKVRPSPQIRDHR